MMLNSKESKRTNDIFQKDVAELNRIALEQVINIKKDSKKDIEELLKNVSDDYKVTSYFEDEVKKIPEKISKITQLNVNVIDKSEDSFKTACTKLAESVYLLDEILKPYILNNNVMVLTLCFDVEKIDKHILEINNLRAGYCGCNFHNEIRAIIEATEKEIVIKIDIPYDKWKGMKEAYDEILTKANKLYMRFIRGIK